MTKEQAMLKEKDNRIEQLENINKFQSKDIGKAVDYAFELNKEIEEKDKTIDLMAEFIEDELTVDEFCTKEGCYADNYIDGHCEKCLNCIKQYFENKAKERR